MDQTNNLKIALAALQRIALGISGDDAEESIAREALAKIQDNGNGGYTAGGTWNALLSRPALEAAAAKVEASAEVWTAFGMRDAELCIRTAIETALAASPAVSALVGPAPFKLPVRIEDGNYLVAEDCELICALEDAEPAERDFIVAAINGLGPTVEA